jgi:hypothetical protein
MTEVVIANFVTVSQIQIFLYYVGVQKTNREARAETDLFESISFHCFQQTCDPWSALLMGPWMWVVLWTGPWMRRRQARDGTLR